ncbi:hypothetical protein ACIBI3_06905 [Actinomadura luteofluorescens]|uniref:hypothetical protein n=1 Tax=Actinomadura luteofluorescens TaxID=46163 RepID=UPI00349017F4
MLDETSAAEQAAGAPPVEDRLDLRLAKATDSLGVCLSRAARAIIRGRIDRVNTSPMAGFDGPG